MAAPQCTHCPGQELCLKTIPLAIVVTVVTSACVTSNLNRSSTGEGDTPPQLWSDHKLLQIPVDACAERAFNVLSALGYSGVVRNGNYSYGNFNENRAAVKCVDNGGSSFVYLAVAGPRRETVEGLRDAITRKL